jgi:Divergent InlB B-repeat domain
MQTFKGLKNVRKLFALPLAVLTAALIFSFLTFDAQSPIQNVLVNSSQTITQKGNRLPASPRFAAYPLTGRPNITMYDEQLGTTFTQNFTALAYTLTAVAQSGIDNYGPAYLLNGLANTGYWYQIGLAYNWDGNPTTGFQLAYEVFNPSGFSVFPVSGGGMATFSPVNPGDTILLSLSFSNGSVVMQGTDQTSGAHTQETYTAAGATTFVGNASSLSNSQGFFTGLMTEWYHTNPYYGDEQKVTYNTTGSGITSAWLWMDEFSVAPNGIMSGLFGKNSPAPVSLSNPTQLQSLSSNGATVSENATQFITGNISTVALTFGYSVTGGGSTPPAPTLTYISAGVKQTATLTQTNQAFLVDIGSSWSVANQLSSSTSTERWATNQATTGTAVSAQTISFAYYHEYMVTFGFSVIGGGTNYTAPSVNCQQFGSAATQAAGTPAWVDTGTYSFPMLLTGSSTSERWAANSTSGMISSSGNINAEYFHQYLTTVSYSVIEGGTPGAPTFSAATFGSSLIQTLTIQPQALWVDSSATYSVTNLLSGATSTEQWQPSASTTGNVVSSSTINIPYYHQYYVTINQNPKTGGVVSSVSNWYNAGTSLQSDASANPGWQFESWSGSGQGSYSGENSSALTTVESALTETATFYPGLTITVSDKLSVAYVYGTSSGLVPSNTFKIIYSPSGTDFQLTAKPKLFIYSFAGWTGSITDKKSNVSTALNTPQNITANFSYNYVNIGLTGAGVIILIAAAIILVTRRKKKPPTVISG